jgi:hypothetical protein
MTLDELLAATRTDRKRMPELVAMSRRLLRDPDPETRTHAASMAFYAVRQLLPSLTIAQRTSLCEQTLVELDAAVARGLTGPEKPLAGALRSVLIEVIENPLEIDEQLRQRTDRIDLG